MVGFMLVGTFNKEKALVAAFSGKCGTSRRYMYIDSTIPNTEASRERGRRRGNFLFSLNFAIENINDV